MHQADFAKLTTIPVATIRAIESGRRTMTWENCRERIGYLLGARFSEQDREWHYMLTKDLYTFSHYQAFTDKRAKDPFLKTKCLHAATFRLLALLKAVPPDRWFQFFGCVMSKLRDAADEFGIKARTKILDQTEPVWALVTPVQDADGKRYPPDTPPAVATEFLCLKQNDKTLRAKDAGGLLDFREWREF